jgi:uronate dehydrogenase
MLSTYLSFDDLTQLCVQATLAPETGCMVVWGASANQRTYWGRDDRERIGWAAQDSADHFAGQLAGKVSDSPIQEAYQGGAYTVIDNSRGAPAPGRLY